MAVSFSISEIRELSEVLSQKVGLPFKHMTHSFLKRRLAMFFDKCGIRKVDQFMEQLDDADFIDELCHFFSINTTELFRDAGFWRQLRKLIAETYPSGSVHIWLPDVASGEELYSLLILLKEMDSIERVHITVNSTSSRGIGLLKTGALPVKKMDVNAYNYKRFEGVGSLDNYFNTTAEGIVFDTALLKNVVFQQAGIEQVPAHQSDIIIVRNSLLYYTRDYHEMIKDVLDKALKNGGFICLGVKEQLPLPYEERFECIDTKEKIYNKFRFLKD